jgi:hypothetical protein
MIALLEPYSPAALAVGLAYAALLTAAGLTVGLGLLTLLRAPADPLRRLLLAPFAATMLWALAGTVLVRAGLTLAQVTPLIAALSLALAAVGLMVLARHPPLSRAIVLLVGLELVTGFVTWPAIARGLTAHLGTPNLDTLNYTSIAASFWHYGLDASSASLPYFQYYSAHARALGEARNHTYVLLALFSPLVEPGEPVFVRNLLVAWSLLVLAASLAFYRVTWRDAADGRPASSSSILVYALVTMGLGWAVVPALVGNWDNALFVAVGPVLAGLAAEVPGGPRLALLLGATAAYAFYTYPELSPFLAFFVAPLYLCPLRAPAARQPTSRDYALAAATAAVLLAPGARPLWRYLQSQLIGARGGTRQGGTFGSGLVSVPPDFTAWWVLETGQWGRLLALALAGLALLGLIRLARRRGAEVAAAALVAACLAYYVLIDRYGYAAYKILSIAWWLVGRCLVEGAAALVGRPVSPTGRLRRGLAVAALAALLLPALHAAARERARIFFDESFFRRQPTLAALTRLRSAAAGQPPMDVFLVSSAFDPLTLPWIFYALKDSPLRVFHERHFSSPLPDSVPLPDDGPIPATVLQPAPPPPGAALRFLSPEFALADLASTYIIEHVANPNSLEPWGSWLGTRPITVSLLAGPGLPLALTFEASPGPSRPDSRRTLVIQAGSRLPRRVELDRATRVAVPFVSAGGRETFTLHTPDLPTIPVQSNGDTRPLLIGIRHLQITPRADAPPDAPPPAAPR